MDTAEGTLIYHHNATDAFSGSTQQVKQMLTRIKEVQADSLFISEAYNADVNDTRIEEVAEDIAKMGYAVSYGAYSEKARPDQHGSIAAVRKDLLVYMCMIELAGRGAVEAVLFERSSGSVFTEVKTHLGDHKARRQAELDALFERYGAYLDVKWPLVLTGDLNNAIDETSMFARMMRAGGHVANTLFAAQAKQVEAHINKSVLGRVASLAIRAGGQLDGADITRLLEEGYLVDANTNHEYTSFVPHLPGTILKAVGMVSPLQEWLLNRPHIEADHIMANAGALSKFQVYPRLAGDEHLGISAVYRLAPTQAVA